VKAQLVIANSASFRLDQPVSAGSWATAHATFAGVTTTSAPSYPLPKTLGGVTVTVDGVDAPISYVSADYINFLMPYATLPGLRPVQIKTPGGTVSGSVRVTPSGPGIFVLDTQKPPTGAIRNSDFTVNSAATPAKRGDFIQIYGNGPGPINQQLTDGAAVPSDPQVKTVSNPLVLIGGVPATVLFSGLTPTIAGLWQMNVTVPNLSFLTGRVPVVVFMDGVDSNEVAVFVQ
jgi:uncharacterized protein (TIGR03437 family)